MQRNSFPAHPSTNLNTDRVKAFSLVLLTALLVTACGGADAGQAAGGSGLSGTVRVDGSSTVAPLSTVAAEMFQEAGPGVQVTVGTSGTGGGFEKFCAGETDVSNASRPITDDERSMCAENGIAFVELQLANDALTVVVNRDNTWIDCITIDQLSAIWEPDSRISNWNQVDPRFPDEELTLFGAGTDSGTFDYFTEAVNGEEGASRTDYAATEDDNVTVQGVSGSPGGLGYFGYSYFEQNSDSLKALEIDDGNGCVAPTPQTAQDGTYFPLARPLFVYPSVQAVSRPEVAAFLDFYVQNAATIAVEALFIPLNAEQQAQLEQAANSLLEPVS